jgi:hypothetical protein
MLMLGLAVVVGIIDNYGIMAGEDCGPLGGVAADVALRRLRF